MPLSSSKDELDTSDQISTEERVLRFFLTFLLPFLVTFIAFGVIVLAYSQWKLY